MYAITGITGRVGGAVARALLAKGERVRAVLRNAEKAATWTALGCEIALAEIDDGEALARAFANAEGVFWMVPPAYDPEPGFPETKAQIDALLYALAKAKPGKIVFLSTIGAQVEEYTLLNNSKMIEAALRTLSIPRAFLRAGWFMENAAWDLPAAKAGTIRTFLTPHELQVPMIATADIGNVGASLLRADWVGERIVELEGPRRYSPNDVAAGFAAALGHPVRVDGVPRAEWEAIFRAGGTRNPLPRIRMLDGYNEGWIRFEGGKAEAAFGSTTLQSVLDDIVAAARSEP